MCVCVFEQISSLISDESRGAYLYPLDQLTGYQRERGYGEKVFPQMYEKVSKKEILLVLS